MQRGLPPSSATRLSAIDEEYQKELSELEALRAEVARLRGERPPAAYTPGPADPARRQDWSAPRTPPESYGTAEQYAPTAYPPRSPASGRSAGPAGRQPAAAPTTYAPTARPRRLPVTFIPNSAYVNGSGYDGLEQLYQAIQKARGAVEVRVHTASNMDRRNAQILSEERATTITQFLLERGIDQRHFRVLGYGNNLTGKGGERVEVLDQ